MLGFTYDILQFFAISLEDLRKGVLWSPLLSAAVFAAAAAAILRLIRWQNARIDRTNEEIRRRNQQIDQQTDAQKPADHPPQPGAHQTVQPAGPPAQAGSGGS